MDIDNVKIIMPKRYTDKIEVSGECWLWKGSKTKNGYGRINISGVAILAHRFMWQSLNGEIPNGKYVLHTCDVRHCVNPNHHFLGTPKDNMQDMLNKGRGNKAVGKNNGRYTKPHRTASGERTATSKLTKDQVREIRVSYQRGIQSGGQREGEYSIAGLSRKYKVGCTTIANIVNQRTWKKEAQTS